MLQDTKQFKLLHLPAFSEALGPVLDIDCSTPDNAKETPLQPLL